jgi:hypothetical protein
MRGEAPLHLRLLPRARTRSALLRSTPSSPSPAMTTTPRHRPSRGLGLSSYHIRVASPPSSSLRPTTPGERVHEPPPSSFRLTITSRRPCTSGPSTTSRRTTPQCCSTTNRSSPPETSHPSRCRPSLRRRTPHRRLTATMSLPPYSTTNQSPRGLGLVPGYSCSGISSPAGRNRPVSRRRRWGILFPCFGCPWGLMG